MLDGRQAILQAVAAVLHLLLFDSVLNNKKLPTNSKNVRCASIRPKGQSLQRYVDQKAGLSLNDLPKIDLVLISHNHYDHLDLPSIVQILVRDDPLFIVPLKNGPLLKNVGVQNMVELDWWQTYSLNEKQKVVLTPAQHWSGRGAFDDCKSLWGGLSLKVKE